MRLLNRLGLGSFTSGSLIYLLSNVISASIPFLLLPVMTRYLTPAEYGQIAIFLGMVAALAAFTGLNANGAAARKYYDDVNANQLRIFMGACLRILLASSGLLLLSAILFRAILARHLGIEAAWVPLAVVVSTANFVINLRLTQWQIRKQALQYGSMQVAQSALSLILSLLAVVALQMGAEGRVMAQTSAAIVGMLAALWLLQRDHLLSLSSRREDVREALHYGVPLVPHVSGLFLLAMADRFIINAELGTAQVGIYMVAAQISSVMGVLFDAINKSYIPWLFERLKRNDAAENRQTVQLTYAYFVGALLLALLFALLGPTAITFIAGQRYAAAGEVVGWLALGQAFGGGYFMVTNYIFFSKKTGMMSLATLCCGAINIALLLVLVKAYGLHGAAIAYAAAMACRFFWMWWLAQRRHPMPWRLARAER